VYYITTLSDSYNDVDDENIFLGEGEEGEEDDLLCRMSSTLSTRRYFDIHLYLKRKRTKTKLCFTQVS